MKYSLNSSFKKTKSLSSYWRKKTNCKSVFFKIIDVIINKTKQQFSNLDQLH